MKQNIMELKRKYLALVEKRKSGEEIPEEQEWLINDIVSLQKGWYTGDDSSIERFFDIVSDLVLIENI